MRESPSLCLLSGWFLLKRRFKLIDCGSYIILSVHKKCCRVVTRTASGARLRSSSSSAVDRLEQCDFGRLVTPLSFTFPAHKTGRFGPAYRTV